MTVKLKKILSANCKKAMDNDLKNRSRPEKRANIIDIAREVGVSPGLVSVALSGRPSNIGMTREKRKKIQETARRLQYSPNWIARSLISGKSLSIGLIVPPLCVPIEALLVEKLCMAVKGQGYMPLIVDVHSPLTDEQPEPLLSELKELICRQVDGLVVYQTMPLPRLILEYIDIHAVPCVYINWSPPQAENVVHITSEAGNRDMLRHLAELGHRSVQPVVGEYDRVCPDARLHPLLKANEDFGLDLRCSGNWTVHGLENLEETTYKLVKERVQKKDLPTALVFFEDLKAIAGMAALRDAGVRIPEDVSVIGRGGLPVGSMVSPSLTTQCHPDQRYIAETACSILCRLIDKPQAAVSPVTVKYEFLVRNSTGPAPVQHGNTESAKKTRIEVL